MRIFLSALILIFSFQSFTKADDISKFEIEGMSIGDSLLNYFSKNNIEEEINSKFSYKYKGNKFVKLGVGDTSEFPLFKKLEQYDELGITVKPNDKKYIIYGLAGETHCKNNIKKCFSVKDEIIRDLKILFKDLTVKSWEEKHPIDKTGKSIVYGNTLSTESINGIFQVSIYDMFSDNYTDAVDVSFRLKEYSDFIKYEAYN
tara:strand:+ start:137 stop:742 length:606 start_codon:yes stop_codon:yes gene_type:complete